MARSDNEHRSAKPQNSGIILLNPPAPQAGYEGEEGRKKEGFECLSWKCCQCENIASVKILPVPMLPVSNWGTGNGEREKEGFECLRV